MLKKKKMGGGGRKRKKRKKRKTRRMEGRVRKEKIHREGAGVGVGWDVRMGWANSPPSIFN
jgi:hypothetical protein